MCSSDLARGRHQAEFSTQAEQQVLGNETAAWSVVYANAVEPLAPSGLNRTVKVVAVDSVYDALEAIGPARRLLQTVGVALSPERLAPVSERLGAAGVTRICALGKMTAPEAGWHHDGRFNLLDLVTLTEVEHSSIAASEALAPYAD